MSGSNCCSHPSRPEYSLSLQEQCGAPRCVAVTLTFTNKGWPYSGQVRTLCFPFTANATQFHSRLEPLLRRELECAGLLYNPEILEAFIHELVASGRLKYMGCNEAVCKR